MVITMNFNRLETHLHCLREHIQIFQTLDRDPCSHNKKTHQHSFIQNYSEKT